jgi:glycosidase
MTTLFRRSAWLAAAALTLVACAPTGPTAPQAEAPSPYTPKPYVEVENAEWTRDAVIYQINTRQFSPEGTFKGVEAQLPRLKELGVDILWLMPIHPIGEKNRKGSLGSPYSVKDYYGINPEFGTEQDFRDLVTAAQAMGLKVILDWVANHSAWDNPLVESNPEYYIRDYKGDYRPTPWVDWSDIIDFDYSQAGLREYMTKAMVHWVREYNIDGFRCDVAGFVPLDFWEQVRTELNAVKPVFMLAEFGQRDVLKRAFDAVYTWDWNNTLHNIGMGRANAGAMVGFYTGHDAEYPREGMRMLHVANHDQNSWDATMDGRFGPARDAAIVLSFVSEGIPMIYNSQEAGETKRLQFFEKDPIEWQEGHPVGALYKTLIDLKTANSALWNGRWGAHMVQVVNDKQDQVFSFVRFHEARAADGTTERGDGVFVAVNLSAQPADVGFIDTNHHGAYVEHFSGEAASFAGGERLTIPAWGYRVFVKGPRGA